MKLLPLSKTGHIRKWNRGNEVRGQALPDRSDRRFYSNYGHASTSLGILSVGKHTRTHMCMTGRPVPYIPVIRRPSTIAGHRSYF